MLVIGIDPGAGGAIATLWSDPLISDATAASIVDTPTVEVTRGKRTVREVDPSALALLLRDSVPMKDEAHIFIERVGAMPGQGVASMFAFGRAAGIVEGVVAALGFPYTFVPPNAWTLFCGVRGGKDGSLSRARQLYPQMVPFLSRAKDDGRADALLIAHYGLKKGLQNA